MDSYFDTFDDWHVDPSMRPEYHIAILTISLDCPEIFDSVFTKLIETFNLRPINNAIWTDLKGLYVINRIDEQAYTIWLIWFDEPDNDTIIGQILDVVGAASFDSPETIKCVIYKFSNDGYCEHIA